MESTSAFNPNWRKLVQFDLLDFAFILVLVALFQRIPGVIFSILMLTPPLFSVCLIMGRIIFGTAKLEKRYQQKLIRNCFVLLLLLGCIQGCVCISFYRRYGDLIITRGGFAGDAFVYLQPDVEATEGFAYFPIPKGTGVLNSSLELNLPHIKYSLSDLKGNKVLYRALNFFDLWIKFSVTIPLFWSNVGLAFVMMVLSNRRVRGDGKAVGLGNLPQQ